MKPFHRLRDFFAPVAGSIPGLLSLREFHRALLAAMGFGSTASLLVTLLGFVSAHAALFFPGAPTGLVIGVITLVVEVIRRFSHEAAPAPAPAAPPLPR